MLFAHSDPVPHRWYSASPSASSSCALILLVVPELVLVKLSGQTHRLLLLMHPTSEMPGDGRRYLFE